MVNSPAPDATTCKPPPRLRWIPLSLRAFAAGLAVIGSIGAGLIGVRIYPQWAAIRQIEKRGGFVLQGATGPALMRRCIGTEGMKAIDAVDFVWFTNTAAKDADLAVIECLTDISAGGAKTLGESAMPDY